MNQESTFKKIFLRAFLMLFFCTFLILSATTANAQTKTDQQRCEDFQKQFIIDVNGKTINTIGIVPACGEYSSFSTIVLKGINLGLAFAGIIAVLFIIVGGYWYITSAGNEEQSEKGRKTITNAVIGLVVIILSIVIVRVVSNVLVSGK